MNVVRAVSKYPVPLDWAALRGPDCPWAPLIIECDTIAEAAARIGAQVSFLAVPLAPRAIDPARGVLWSFAQFGNLLICPAVIGHALAPLADKGEGRGFHRLITPHLMAAQFVIVLARMEQSVDVWSQVTAHLVAGKQVIFLKGSF